MKTKKQGWREKKGKAEQVRPRRTRHKTERRTRLSFSASVWMNLFVVTFLRNLVRSLSTASLASQHEQPKQQAPSNEAKMSRAKQKPGGQHKQVDERGRNQRMSGC